MPHPKANPKALGATSGFYLMQWIKKAFAVGYLAGFKAAQKEPWVRSADSTILRAGRKAYEAQEEV